MPTISINDEDVIGLGKKLDEFGEVLTDKEHYLLLAMIRAARKHFKAAGTTGNTKPPVNPGRPKLGSTFDAAFIPGRAAEFEDQSELKIGPIEIKGSITISVE